MLRAIKKVKNLLLNIYDSRFLLLTLSWKDFKRRFAGSYFGTFWAFAQPLLTLLVYWIVFQFGFKSGDVNNIPFVLWFTSGIVPWLFISEGFPAGSNSLIEYNYLVKKVVFNINVLPLVKVMSSMYIHCCFVFLLFFISLAVGFWPTLYLIQVLYYLFCAIVLLFSITMLTGAIMVFFRDLNQIIGIILLIGMWATPIAWNLDIISPKYQFIFKLNPVYYIVEGYRDSFAQHVWFWEKPVITIYFWVLMFFLLVIGASVFDRLKPHFADVL